MYNKAENVLSYKSRSKYDRIGNIRTRYLYLLVYLLNTMVLSAQTPTDLAWQAFIKNDRAEALRLLTGAIEKDSTDKRALLTLSLFYSTQKNVEKYREYFLRFLRHEPNPHPYIYAQWLEPAMYEGIKHSKEVRDLYEWLVENPDPQGLLKVMANGQLGDYYQGVQNFIEAQTHYSGIGSVDEWTVTGPFDNISASGYDRVFPPETEYAPGKTYNGKNGVPAYWFKINEVRSDKWIDFTRYFDRTEAVYYANSFVYSDKEQKVQFRIGTSGSLRFFLNDQLIIDVFDENNNDADTYVAETTLQKGWNRLLVKCGYSVIDRCNFLFRITDASGNLISGLKHSTEKQNYKKQTNATVTPVTCFAINYFKEKISANPREYENYFLLANAYLRNDMSYQAEVTLRPLVKSLTPFSLLNYKMLEVFARSQKSMNLEMTFDYLYASDPQYPDVLIYKANEAVGNEDMDQFEAILQKVAELLPESSELYELRTLLYSKKGQQEKLLETVQEAALRFPEILTFQYYKALFDINRNQNYNEAIKIFQKYILTAYDLTPVNQLAGYYLQSGDIASWEKTLVGFAEKSKASPGIYLELGKKFFEMREYQKSAAMIEKGLAIAPMSSALLEKGGDAWLELGEKKKAKEFYAKALTYYPGNYTVREKLRELDGKTPLSSLFQSSDYKTLIADVESPSGANSYILLNDQKRIVYKSGASEISGEVLIRAITRQGIDQIKEYVIPFNPYTEDLTVEKAVVVKKDGSEVKGDVNYNHVVFKSLEAGEHIYVKWKIKNLYSGRLSDQFWDEFGFEQYIPSKMTRYSLLAEDDFKFSHKTQFMDDAPVIKKLDGFTLYEWTMENIPALKPEPDMSALSDVSKRLYISSIPGWDFLVEWYKDLTRNKTRVTFEIEETVAELMPEPDKLSDEEKIEIIYNFITENIRYSSVAFRQSGLIPQEARDVLVTRIGDCKDVATLFITMARVAGITSYYVLINTKDEGFNKNVLPSIGFNHAIVALETEGGLKFLDLTAANFHYETLPELDIDGFYLLIKDGIKAPGHVPDANFYPDNITRKTTLTVRSDDGIEGTNITTKGGIHSAYARYTYRDENPDEQSRIMKEALVAEFPQLSLTSFLTLSDMTDITPEESYMFSFEIPSYISEAGEYGLMKLPWSDKLESSGSVTNDSRKFPLMLWSSLDTLREDMTIILPEGMHPVESSYEQEYSSPAADYRISVSFKDGRLHAVRTMIYKTREVKPVDFQAYKEFYTKAMRADNKQFLLKRSE